ncbi:MAG: reverse transcriptase domain-containing protein, partial [Acidobacteriota bacterium]
RTLRPETSFWAPVYPDAAAWWKDTFSIYTTLAETHKVNVDAIHLFLLTNCGNQAEVTIDKCKAHAKSSKGNRGATFQQSADQSASEPLDHLNIATAVDLSPRLRKSWVRRAGASLRGYRNSDPAARDVALYTFLSTPKYYLRLLSGPASSRQRDAFRDNQLAGKVMEQTSVPPPPAPPPADGDAAVSADDSRKVKSALKLLFRGFVGKACSSLLQGPVTRPAFADAVAALKLLHPHGGDVHSLLIDTDDETFPSLEVDTALAAAKKCCSGASAGRTGLTEELISYLLEDGETAEDLTELMRDITNGNVSQRNRIRLTSCRLVALAKPTKPGGKPSVRPIAIGEALLKICATIVTMSQTQHIQDHFQGIQFGVGTPCGAEYVVHRIRAGVTRRKITVALDASNAFNMPFRRCIREVLLRNPEFTPFYPLWNLCYATPSQLHYQQDEEREIILSQRGVRQGDVLGGIFFSLVIHPILVAAKARYPHIDLYAYLDDITLQGDDTDEMHQCIAFIQAEMSLIGMSLNAEKCEWLSSLPCPLQGWDQKTTYAKILGAFIGDDQFTEPALLKHTTTRHDDFFRRLQLAPSNARMIILGKCGISRLNYVIRTHPKHLSDGAAAYFDAKVRTCWSTFADVEPSRITRMIAHLPCKMGGCGFTEMSQINELAYTASIEFAVSPNAAIQQSQAVNAHHRLVLAKLMEVEGAALHLADCKESGTSKWFTTSKGMPIMHHEAARAAMRLRLWSPHKECTVDATVKCPGIGCGSHQLPYRHINQHLRGCALIKGHNASAAHAGVKTTFHRILAGRGIHFQYKEPEGHSLRQCSTCKVFVQCARVEKHIEEHPSCDASALRNAHVCRADIRFFIPNTGGVVIDVSLVAMIAARGIMRDATAAVASRLNRRNAIKQKLYGDAIEESGETFLVASATANGTLSDELHWICSLIAKASILPNDTCHAVEQELRFGIMEASGLALLNAETRMLEITPPPLAAAAVRQSAAVADLALINEELRIHNLCAPERAELEAREELAQDETREANAIEAFRLEELAELNEYSIWLGTREAAARMALPRLSAVVSPTRSSTGTFIDIATEYIANCEALDDEDNHYDEDEPVPFRTDRGRQAPPAPRFAIRSPSAHPPARADPPAEHRADSLDDDHYSRFHRPAFAFQPDAKPFFPSRSPPSTSVATESHSRASSNSQTRDSISPPAPTANSYWRDQRQQHSLQRTPATAQPPRLACQLQSPASDTYGAPHYGSSSLTTNAPNSRANNRQHQTHSAPVRVATLEAALVGPSFGSKRKQH